jgi:hypothetical protein
MFKPGFISKDNRKNPRREEKKFKNSKGTLRLAKRAAEKLLFKPPIFDYTDFVNLWRKRSV